MRRIERWLRVIDAKISGRPYPPRKGLFRGGLASCLVGVGVAAGWTLVGYAIARLQNDQETFIAEWHAMQAFPCLALGTWLCLIVRSGELACRAMRLTKDGAPAPEGIRSSGARVIVAIGISILGATVFTMMGFNARGPLLGFMWAMCAFICYLAGPVTLHAADLIVTIHNLQRAEIKTHRYSPAHTPELRELVSYFTYFSFLMTIAYAFVCFGTLGGHWTGNPTVVKTAQLFWPAVYVPACSVALTH